ncbi:MAG: hypothetical protein ACPL7K_05740, partial [Armatimonadota bacterium]
MVKARVLVSLTLIPLICASTSCLGFGLKYKTSGTYTDGAGAQHAWSVSEAHTLIWDGRPFVPTGVVFRSRCIALGLSDANFEADVRLLEKMKSAGIT